jgi:hypothetical protein
MSSCEISFCPVALKHSTSPTNILNVDQPIENRRIFIVNLTFVDRAKLDRKSRTYQAVG